MPFTPTNAGRPKALFSLAQGNALGFIAVSSTSPEGASHERGAMIRPFRASVVYAGSTQGVALGWYEIAPLVLQLRSWAGMKSHLGCSSRAFTKVHDTL